MASDFYHVLLSNASMTTHPNNTLAQYITNLPRRISLSGGGEEWECGLTEINYPHDWYNVRKARLTVEHYGETETDAYFEDGYYGSPEALVKTLIGDKPGRVKFYYEPVTQKVVAHMKGDTTPTTRCANPDYKVRIVDAVLFVRKTVLSPTVAMAHIRALEKGTAKYPLRPVDCKIYSIPQGAMSSTHENLFLGTLPKRIILWCVDNDALNGAFVKNPFHAKNNGINFLAVYIDGRQVPAKPLQPNFETGQ